MKYAIDALDDESLKKPQQIVLISPMIGISRFARFSNGRMDSLSPGLFSCGPVGLVPEFNPFKYNSFPVNGARQAYLLTETLKRDLTRRKSSAGWKDLPHVLTFQSVLDSTVSTRAVLDVLHHNLPDNGSELVLFDINRAVNFRSLFRHFGSRAITLTGNTTAYLHDDYRQKRLFREYEHGRFDALSTLNNSRRAAP